MTEIFTSGVGSGVAPGIQLLPTGEAAPVSVDVVVPVYNEQVGLGPSVHRLHAYLAEELRYPFQITIADNASTDDTLAIAEDLAVVLDRERRNDLTGLFGGSAR